jgi:hypothetical protein
LRSKIEQEQFSPIPSLTLTQIHQSFKQHLNSIYPTPKSHPFDVSHPIQIKPIFETAIDSPKPITMSNDHFNLNTLKGRMAEQLIQDLFNRNGYNVFNYCLERIHPFLSTMLRDNYQTTSKALRFMPDFVVQSTQTGDLFYLEVKFRANGNFAFEEKYKDYPYKNAWFVIVSPEKIQCIHYRRLAAGHSITPHTKYRLTSVRSFHITKESIAEYEDYARQFFGAFSKNDNSK